MEKNGRIKYIDIAKGIGILCVIIGHMGWTLADRIIFPFHMPLFFLMSGYFLSKKYPFIKFVKLKFRQLLMPYLWTCIAGCFLAIIANVFLSRLGMGRQGLLVRWVLASLYGSGLDYSEPFSIYGVGAIWFLLTLFLALILVYLLGDIAKGYIFIIMIAGMSLFSSKYIWLPWSVQAGGTAAVFVYVGYVVKQKNLLSSWSRKLAWVGLLVWIIEAILDIHVDMSRNVFEALGITIIGAVLICYFILYMSSKLTQKNVFTRSLEFLGQNSLLILCFHSLEIKFFPWSLVYAIFHFSVDIANIVILTVRIVFCVLCTVTFRWIVAMSRKRGNAEVDKR